MCVYVRAYLSFLLSFRSRSVCTDQKHVPSEPVRRHPHVAFVSESLRVCLCEVKIAFIIARKEIM